MKKILVCLVACAMAHSAPQHEPLPVRSVYKSAFSRMQGPADLIIRSDSDWKNLWGERLSATKDQPPPPVNFEKEMLVVAAMGARRSGGFFIEIAKAEKSEGRIKVFIRRKEPARSSMVIHVLTSPVHVVAIPKSGLAVEFVAAKGAED